jgi:acetate kinase
MHILILNSGSSSLKFRMVDSPSSSVGADTDPTRIGERAPDIRSRICEGMGWCGLSLDCHRNFEASEVQPGAVIPIHSKESTIELLVSGTDEESWVARETFQCLSNAS